MAKETTLDPLYLGTDFSYAFHVKNDAEDTSIEITGWALSFVLKVSPADADTGAILIKTVGSGITISGTFSATPSANTQRATVAIADTDTDVAPECRAWWELKRTDAGFETILAYGRVELRRGVHRTW